MQLIKIPLQDTNSFKNLFLDYVANNPALDELYNYRPDIEGLRKSVLSRYSFPVNRELLTDVIIQQYDSIEIKQSVADNINALKNDNCFTITTGHQLCLAMGPMYILLKALTCIKVAEVYNQKFTDSKIVPVFWLASEDHDFEEINHVNILGKKYEWHNEQSGACGRMTLEGIDEVLKAIPDLPAFVLESYRSETLSLATRKLLNHVFGSYGLILIDGDDEKLKNEATLLWQKELKECFSKATINATNDKLKVKHYDIQVHARDINLFYLDNQMRVRIEKHDGYWATVDEKFKWNDAELNDLLNKDALKLSPNVILRPLYESIILPDVCYVGGPGEVAYWLQLKSTFDYANVFYPLVMPRIFGGLLSEKVLSKITPYCLVVKDLFLEEKKLKNKVVEKLSSVTLDKEKYYNELAAVYEDIESLVNSVDHTLIPVVGAEHQKVKKQLDDLLKRILKAEERKHEEKIKSVFSVKEKLLPNGVLQERKESVVSYLIKYPNIVDLLYKLLDVFDHQLQVVTHE
jgi:bacillithiol biosynthesis cysteine-adding enzyme BshC